MDERRQLSERLAFAIDESRRLREDAHDFCLEARRLGHVNASSAAITARLIQQWNTTPAPVRYGPRWPGLE